MSSTVTDITVFISADNKMFAFNTEYIIKSPLNAFIPYYVGFTIINNVKIIKLSLLTAIIESYLLLTTGTPIYPLFHNNLHMNNNVSCDKPNEQEVNFDFDDDEVLKSIEDDITVEDFEESVENLMFDFIGNGTS